MVKLHIITRLNFTNYHEPSPPSYEVMANSITSSLQLIKHEEVCSFIAASNILPAKLILRYTPGLL